MPDGMMPAQIDLARPQGGFWIDAQGALIPVEEKCRHLTVIGIERNIDCYNDAYAKGFVRVSTCSEDDSGFYVTCVVRHVTVAALRSVVNIARHHAQHRPHSDWRFEDNADYTAYFSFPDGHAFARKVMQLALDKNATEMLTESRRDADQGTLL